MALLPILTAGLLVITGSAVRADEQSVSIRVKGPEPTESPEPTSSPDPDCIETQDENGNPEDTFAFRGKLRVLLRAGCAGPSETGIEVEVHSFLQRLTVMKADAAGGFHTRPLQLSANVEPGPHEVIVITRLHTYRAPITVTPVGDGGPGNGGGAQVLGSSGGRGGSGPLPKTGLDIARFAGLGALLVILGWALVFASRERRRARQIV